MSNIIQNGKNGKKTLGMGYLYILLIGSLFVPYFLGYAGVLVLPEFKSSNLLFLWLIMIALIWLVVGFLYFTLCLIKQAQITPHSQSGTVNEGGKNLQIIKLNVPILRVLNTLKVLRIPQSKINIVRFLLKAIIFQDIVYIAFLFAIVVLS